MTNYIPDKTTKMYVCISIHFLLNSSFIIFFSFIKTSIFICKRKKNLSCLCWRVPTTIPNGCV